MFRAKRGGGLAVSCPCDGAAVMPGFLQDREKRTAGKPTVSKHIITVSAWKTATGPDLTEREKDRGCTEAGRQTEREEGDKGKEIQ